MPLASSGPGTAARVVALTGLAPVAWGSTYAVTTEFLPPDRPLFTAFMRALPAGLLLWAASRATPRGEWWWKSAVLGALNIGAFFPLLFLAAYRLPGGVAAVLGAVGPLFAAGFAALLLAERLTPRTVAAGMTGVLGVTLVVLRAEARLDAVGIVAGVAGTASMAAGTVLTKRWGRPAGTGVSAMASWQLVSGGLLLLPLAFFVEGPPPPLDAPALAGYAYMAVLNTALAYLLWLRGISRLPATSVSFLALLSPLSAAALGWGLLGEDLTGLQLAGMALTFAGVLWGQRATARGSRRPPVPGVTQDGPAPGGTGRDVTSQKVPGTACAAGGEV
ncbi:EamA family transporter [Streptomyces heilongjiangensis]|uniref:EamA family transporter n=1 Tax=Streptomyces heilongjiangensis TaxID=945052 RepID=A0ABW1AZ73_9ACTN|nr:EamA family transporter [Streptomyces heilongjiangensis]MDC2947926.1 EamA family transporter [Streptomyces heilongjiangensis]